MFVDNMIMIINVENLMEHLQKLQEPSELSQVVQYGKYKKNQLYFYLLGINNQKLKILKLPFKIASK